MIQCRRMGFADSLTYLKKLAGDLTGTRDSIIVMPEKWVSDEIIFQSGRFKDIMDAFSEFSLETRSIFVPGSYSIREGNNVYNRSMAFSAGNYLGFQDKISLYRMESERFSSGHSIEAFDCSIFKLGIPVCYDLDFPYFSKVLVQKGVTISANPSLIQDKFHRMWHIYVRGRSLENRMPVISVNSMSEPFGGDSIVTGMRDDGDGIILEEENAGKQEIFFSDLEYLHLPDLVERRRSEDPGYYSLKPF